MSVHPVRDASEFPALKPVLRAGRIGRFRLLDVACPKDHRLVEVLKTGDGPTLLAKAPVESIRTLGGVLPSDEYGQDVVYEVEVEHNVSRARYVACFLADLDDDAVVRVQCRCRAVDIPAGWVRDRIAHGRVRVQWDAPPAHPLMDDRQYKYLMDERHLASDEGGTHDPR